MVVIAAAGVEGLFGPLVGDRESTRAARRTLRDQIARLERDLAETTTTGFPRVGVTVEETRVAARARGPRILDLGELEALRDDLAGQLRFARHRVTTLSESQQKARERLEAMFLEPRRHKWARVSFEELGERSCGDWLVRPRLGIIGMLMGWWQIKLSSGCPLAWPLMGKRSRKRDVPVTRKPVAAAAQPAPRTLDRRARLDELPKPPWAPFPLVELCVLIGIVLIGVGIFGGTDRGGTMVLAGVALAGLAGLEQAAREHFAGFRSHTTLLAGVLAIIALSACSLAGLDRIVALAVAVGVMGSSWPLLRNSFTRRSGGLSFRA